MGVVLYQFILLYVFQWLALDACGAEPGELEGARVLDTFNDLPWRYLLDLLHS